MLKIYTDGSAAPNPGPGGYGMIVLNGNEIWAYQYGNEENTTNNRMELTAMLKAIQFTVDFPEEQFIVYSDSKYCVNIINN